MQAALAIFLLTTNPVDVVFDRVERQYANLQTSQIQATALTDVGSKKFNNSYRFTYERGKVVEIRYNEPNTTLPQRTLLIEPGRTILIVPSLHQYTVRPRTGGLQDDIKASDDIDPVLGMHLEPLGFKEWLKPMRELSGWKVRKQGKNLTADYKKGGHQITINFSTDSALLKTFTLQAGEQFTKWSLTYGAKPAAVRYQPTALDLRVDQIDPNLTLPKFEDAVSKAAIVKAIGFYARTRDLSYTATSEGKKVNVSIKNQTFRQESDDSAISYNGKNLVVLDKKSSKAFSGEAKMSQVLGTVSAIGQRIDPVLYNLALGNHPIRVMLASAESMKSVGSATIDGEVCDMLSARGKGIELMLTIERSTGRLRSTTSQVISSSGPISPTTVIYHYQKNAADESALHVQIPAGYERLPVLSTTNSG